MITSLIKKQEAPIKLTEKKRKEIIGEVFSICHQINGIKDRFVVSTLLKICLEYRFPSKVELFWEDIVNIEQHQNAQNMYPLLMKCCIECKDLEKCIEVLKWIESANYRLKLRDSFIIKLIQHRDHSVSALRFIHRLIKGHLIENDGKTFQTALINAYAQRKSIDDAQRAFDDIDDDRRDIVSICAMMTVWVNNGYYDKALALYDQYDNSNDINPNGVRLDHIAHSLAIKACCSTADVERVKAIDRKMQNSDSILPPIALQTSLIDFYGNHGSLQRAQDIFECIDRSQMDVVCIGAMMKSYVNNGRFGEAMSLYDSMEMDRDEICHCLAMKACTHLRDEHRGREIQREIEYNGYCSIQTKNTLVDFYGEFGDIDNAEYVFASIAIANRDTICYNAMMGGYLKNERETDSLLLFEQLNKNGVCKPDTVSYTTALIACTNLSGFQMGENIENQLREEFGRYIEALPLQISLINLYGKWGKLAKCDEIFNEIERREPNKYSTETPIWNAMIQSVGKQGDLERALQLFEMMKQGKGPPPDHKTYVSLLGSCSHCFAVDEAKRIWNEEMEDEDMKYDCYVIAAVVDGLSRIGYVNEAYEFVLEYETFHENKRFDEIMWTSLFSACRTYKTYLLAQRVYDDIERRFKHNESFMADMKLLYSNIFKSRLLQV